MIVKQKFSPTVANLRLVHQGKTRDTFATNDPDLLLVVATDRLSTHNVIHESVVPGKGEVLTALTIFWLVDVLEAEGIPHHLVAYGKQIFDYLPGSVGDYPPELQHRAIIVCKYEVHRVEFIFRAYMTGSLWRIHSKGQPDPYYLNLPQGLRLMSKFESPIFTPTEKSEIDDPLRSSSVRSAYPMATRLSELVFERTRFVLNHVGLEMVDSKLEIGIDQYGKPVLVDEVATPDSSRFCLLSAIKEGEDPPWFDKQIARDEAERIWGTNPKIPLMFSPEITMEISSRYRSLFSIVTGQDLNQFQKCRL